MQIDTLLLHALNGRPKKEFTTEFTELSLSQLSRIFSKRPLLLALERLVVAGKVACRFDGRDYHYRVA